MSTDIKQIRVLSFCWHFGTEWILVSKYDKTPEMADLGTDQNNEICEHTISEA